MRKGVKKSWESRNELISRNEFIKRREDRKKAALHRVERQSQCGVPIACRRG